MEEEGQRELRILILEDVPADAELMEHELRKAGIVFTSRRVVRRLGLPIKTNMANVTAKLCRSL